MTPPALQGVRVVDLADEKAVFATRILADLGADVIRVEPPDGGRLRRLAPFLDDEPGVERGLQHLHHNANKRSIVLDVTTPHDVDVLRRLVGSADVLVETESPGRMADLGLGPDALMAGNTRLIYVSVTPFGQDGPLAHWKANDLVAQAAGGLAFVTGHRDDPPSQSGGDQGYKMGSLAAAAGVLIALTGRDADGRGTHLDISLQECVAMAVVQTSNPNHYAWRGHVPTRPGMTAVHRCADDNWVTMNVSANRVAVFLEWLADQGIETEHTEDSLRGRDAMPHLHAVIRQLATRYPRHQFLAEAWARDIWSLPVNALPDLLTCDHLVETGQFLTVRHDGLGADLSFPRSPVDAMGDVRIGRAPLLGEHTEAILDELEVRT